MITFGNFEILVWLPVALLLVLILTLYKSKTKFGTRWSFIIVRFLIIMLVFLALSDMQLLTTTPKAQQGVLTVLVDNSTSMEQYGLDLHEIKTALSGVPISVQTIAAGNESVLISRIAGSLYQSGNFLVLSDGQATDGTDFTPVRDAAFRLDATLHGLELENTFDDAAVTILGPQKTLLGANNTFVIEVLGNDKLTGSLEVFVDGESVYTSNALDASHKVYRAFNDLNTHTISAQLLLDDRFSENNAYYKTIRVVKKPAVFYMGSNERLSQFLEQFFTVSKGSAIPANLDPYASVIIADEPGNQIETDALESYLGEGNGLAVFGGSESFGFGAYDSRPISSLLPVKSGNPGPRDSATLVILIDISYSTSADTDAGASGVEETQKALAYSIVSSLSNDNYVGVVGFNNKPYLISSLSSLGSNRAEVLDKISRLQHSSWTELNVGMDAAYQMLSGMSGEKTVVFISDGRSSTEQNGDLVRFNALVRQMGAEGIKVYSVGVGAGTNEDLMRNVATITGGLYLTPGQTDTIAIEFGEKTAPTGSSTFGLSISDDTHIITQNVKTPQTKVNNVNKVLPKIGARQLVHTSRGDLALTTWRYGLGRVAAWTTFIDSDSYGSLLDSESALFSRIVTWTTGDPDRKNPPLLTLRDGTIFEPISVTLNTGNLDSAAISLGTDAQTLRETLHLQKTAADTYEGTIVPTEVGLHTVFGHAYAVNTYPEFQKIGQSFVIEGIVAATEGSFLKQNNLSDLRVELKNRARDTHTFVPINWMLIAGALLLFIVDILVRQIKERRKNEQFHRE